MYFISNDDQCVQSWTEQVFVIISPCRKSTPDWTENSFTIVVYEKIVTVWTENSDLTFKINFL